MRVYAGVLLLVLLAACGGCQNDGQDRSRDAAVARSGRSSAGNRQATLAKGEITGTVRHVDLEGGFYGIETDDGAKLDPVNLPQEFQKDGTRLRAQVEPLKDRVSTHMWGTLVRITSIERL
ncbi:MAG: hypothetical protein ACM3VT_13305 [Solirubrobacterales bacterium]